MEKSRAGPLGGLIGSGRLKPIVAADGFRFGKALEAKVAIAVEEDGVGTKQLMLLYPLPGKGVLSGHANLAEVARVQQGVFRS